MAKRMSEDELRALTDSEMRLAVGYWSGKLANQRQKAMVYYLGEAKLDLAPPEVDGRSAVVSPDVRNTIESMLPQLMVKFCGGDSVVEFEPTKPGDEAQAEQATDYCNHLFFSKNPGEKVAYNWMKDALLSKNGIIKVWWDTRWDERREEYQALSDVELAQLLDDEEIEVIEQKSYPDEEDAEQRQEALGKLQDQLDQALNAAQQGNQQAAQAIPQIQGQLQHLAGMPPKMLFDVVCKRVDKNGRVRVENVPPEEFMISRKAKSVADATFVGHRVARTLSELKSMGYKNVDEITSDDQAASLNMERIERLSFDDEMAYLQMDNVQSLDTSQRQVWVTECYIRCDYDGDGIAELRKVVRAGNQILENEVCDVAPFVAITPVPMPHKFFGLSVADLALEGQKIKTQILRGMLDNMYLQINGRYFAVEGQVNLDDLLTSRPGGVVRMKGPNMAGRLDQGMGDSNVGMGMMEFMSGYLEDSTGWTRYNQGSDGDSLNQTATGVNQITNRADMRLDLIARCLAEGWRDLFRLILRLCSQYQSKQDVVKLRGNWVPVSPREWRNGFNLTINVGLGTGSKDQQVQHLMMLSQQQAMGLQVGTATPVNVYEAQKELAKALGFKSGDKFFTDPRQMPPRPQNNPAEIQAKVEQMKAQLKAQTDQQSKAAELQLERERMAMQAQVDRNRQEAEAQQQQLKMSMERELEQFKIQAQMQLEQFKASLEQDTALKVVHMNNEAKLIQAQMQAKALATAEMDNAADAALGDEANER
jgi:soluble cytochrome b562